MSLLEYIGVATVSVLAIGYIVGVWVFFLMSGMPHAKASILQIIVTSIGWPCIVVWVWIHNYRRRNAQR